MNDLEPPFPWMKDSPDTFKHHLENPEPGVDAYARRKRIDLGQRLASLRRIYLDTKYWLYLRDVRLNRPQKDIHVEVHDELKRLRSAGRTICPISYPIFSELLYQSDRATRSATAQMIDEFSDGCSIQPPEELFKRELTHFFTRNTNSSTDLHDVVEMVWTKASFVLGDSFVRPSDAFPKNVAAALAKAFDDFLWSVSLENMVETLPTTDGIEQQRNVQLASILTDGKFTHQESGDSFQSLFQHEIAGLLDGVRPILADYMLHKARVAGITEEVTRAAQDDAGRMLANLIRTAFAHGKLVTEMPSISIPAALHALVRLDKNRKYKKGDFEDFHHATAAIGYCDLFLTETSLRHLVNMPDFACKRIYGTTVLADETEVIECLRSLE